MTQRILSWWIDVWRGEPHASDLAMQGEHRVARSRVLLIAGLTLTGLVVVAVDPSNTQYWEAIPINLVCLLAAGTLLMATRRGHHRRALSMATSIGDVSTISILHATALWEGHASAAVNGRITFFGYFLALVGTCVRYDGRLPLVAGAVAAAQYAGIVIWSAAIWPDAPTPDVVAYGLFDAGVQVERVVTLLLFAGVCAAIARWTVELRASATHDELTGLLNRRHFERQLHSELLRARRLQEPVSLAMIDVDHFKLVNDTWGHPAGDAALRQIAGLLGTAVRRTDLVARWGGEEFALAFPGVPAAVALNKVEQLRARLATHPVAMPDGETIQLTISAGVADVRDDATPVAELLQAADARLLDAKRGGRNRVVGPARLTLVDHDRRQAPTTL